MRKPVRTQEAWRAQCRVFPGTVMPEGWQRVATVEECMAEPRYWALPRWGIERHRDEAAEGGLEMVIQIVGNQLEVLTGKVDIPLDRVGEIAEIDPPSAEDLAEVPDAAQRARILERAKDMGILRVQVLARGEELERMVFLTFTTIEAREAVVQRLLAARGSSQAEGI